MPFYEKGDVRIHYEEAGSGFPLLVIPGGGLNSTVAGLATHPFNPLDEFKGDKKIGVTLGTNYDQMARAVPGINVLTYPGAPEKLRDLAAKRIDATIDDRLMLPYIIKNSQLPLRTGAVLKGADQEMGIPFRKDNPKFAKALDDALTQMKQDSTLKKISMHWFGTDVTQPVAQ